VATVRPFRGFRPAPKHAAAVASVPYDVVNTSEARALAEGNPLSFLHVIRAEIDLPDGVDPHADEVYARARQNLHALIERRALVREETLSLYLYRQVMGDHAQTGVVGAYSVDEYDDDRIVKHERTRKDKEADRTHHAQTLGAQTGPVFLTFRSTPEVDAIMAAAQAEAPLLDLTAPDGVRHTVWRPADPGPLAAAFEAVSPLYVADGHHRSQAASNVRAARRADGTLTGDDPSHRFLAVAVPTHSVQILPYNRLLFDLGGRSAAAFLEAVGEVGELVPCDAAPADGHDGIYLYLAGAWYRLGLVPLADTPVGRLAPQMLQDHVLSPLIGITDPRTDDRIAFVGGIRGVRELVTRVDRGEGLCAFSLPAVTPDELLAVADAGLCMPPKCTWFEPKLRSGLFVYPLEVAVPA